LKECSPARSHEHGTCAEKKESRRVSFSCPASSSAGAKPQAETPFDTGPVLQGSMLRIISLTATGTVLYLRVVKLRFQHVTSAAHPEVGVSQLAIMSGVGADESASGAVQYDASRLGLTRRDDHKVVRMAHQPSGESGIVTLRIRLNEGRPHTITVTDRA
jgi:hypothetical protein